MLYVENLPMLGNPQKGVELAERAIHLNPNYPAWYLYGLHRVYYFAGEFEKALAAARQAQDPVRCSRPSTDNLAGTPRRPKARPMC